MSPRRRGAWLVRALGGLLAAVLLLAAAGILYQAIGAQIDRRSYPPPGQLVDVGGYRLHLYCSGENAGGRATVILEAGLGGYASSPVWAWVQPEVAKTTRVCAYDRAGLGWSEPGPAPRDARRIAGELHGLLQASHTPGPYVLVGWSFGGLYARAFTDQFPGESAGLVLLDSSSPEQCTFSPAWAAQCAATAQNAAAAASLARLGVLRVIGFFQPATGLPDAQDRAIHAFFASSQDWDAQNSEFQAAAQTNAEVLSAKSLGATPLYVLTATDHGAPPELEQQWQAWQAGYTALSSNSAQRVVQGATHNSLVFSQEDSQATIGAILKVVEVVRTGIPLKP